MFQSLNPSRPTIAEIDLEALRFNLRSVRAFIGPQVKYLAVVKANAYGHGAVECSKALVAEGIDWLAVALVEEGLELRAAGITTPILCLGGFWPGQEVDVISSDLTPVIFRLDQAESLDRAASSKNLIAKLHLKVDTGMRRIGVPFSDLSPFADGLRKFPNVLVDGVMTHFAAADDLSQNDFTELQIGRFNECVQTLRDKGFQPSYIDMANSPGAIAHPESLGNMVRLGGVLYGLGGDVLPKNIEKPELKGVLSMKTRIAQVKQVGAGETLGYGRSYVVDRESTIATIPVGYNDGYRRDLSNNAKMIVKGHLVNVVGRISMDWTMLDVTGIPDIEVGDAVTIIGREDETEILAENLAEWAGTISYEITCGITSRVPRAFKATS